MTFFPKFEFYVHDEYKGMLTRRFSLFAPQYDIDFNGWKIQGDFMQWNYEILDRNGALVADIHKEVLHMSDTYIIDVRRDEDVLYAFTAQIYNYI